VHIIESLIHDRNGIEPGYHPRKLYSDRLELLSIFDSLINYQKSH